MHKVVNHINLADTNGQIYCRLLDRVVDLNEEHQNNHCSNCRMLSGSAQGNGVECEWTDSRPGATSGIRVVNDARMEADSITIEDAKKRKKK